MNYYTAPMEGLTDRIWRQAHQRWFGAPGAPARYYAPFISPPENRVLIKKKMAELDPAANPGAPVIPQLLAKDGALAALSVDYYKLGVQTGHMAADILDGKIKPETAAIQHQKEYTIVINKKDADILGIKIPDEIAKKAQMV